MTPWPFQVLGAGFALFGAAMIVLGARRFLDVERALAEGRFAPLRPAGAVALATLAAALALGTLALVLAR